MANKGWIKLDRKITEHWIFEDSDKFKAWIDLLLMVNHEDKKVIMREGLVKVKKGQTITSIGKLAERWGWSRDKVLRYLRTLEQDGMLTRNSNKLRTVLTIENWDKYQCLPNSHKSSDKLSGKSSDKLSDKSQTRMIKNEKEIKEEELLSADDDFVSDEEWQKRLAEQNEDW